MTRKPIVFGIGLAILLSGVGLMTAKDKKAEPAQNPKREADRLALQKMAKSYIQTIEKGDAKGAASYWTEEGEFIADEGETFRGRAAIEKAYAETFAKYPKRKIDIQVESIRFPSKDTAVVEAVTRSKDAEGELIASSWTHTLLVREDGQWKLALVREWERDVNEDLGLKDLSWLIGTWDAAGKDREVTTSYQWDEKKVFIHGKFSVKEGGKVVESGTQIIGMDKSTNTIRSWLFQSDGGFGGGAWAQDGKKWVVDSAGVLADGRETTATNVFIRVNENAFTWQSINRTLDGQPLADTPPVKVTRQKAAK